MEKQGGILENLIIDGIEYNQAEADAFEARIMEKLDAVTDKMGVLPYHEAWLKFIDRLGVPEEEKREIFAFHILSGSGLKNLGMIPKWFDLRGKKSIESFLDSLLETGKQKE